MTGYGTAEGEVPGGRVRVEIRAVNHRYFNLAPKLPGNLGSLETELRNRLRRDFDRGHITVTVRWVGAGTAAEGGSLVNGGGLSLNVERAREAMARLRELQMAVGLSGDVPLELLARQPDVFVADDDAADRVTWEDLAPVVADAVLECRATRRREGQVLGQDLMQRLAQIRALAGRVEARAPARLVAERDRLRTAVAALLDGRQMDETRVAQEIAIQADRLDITEELVRLRAHLDAAHELLESDQPVGKQLGFLAQELGREINTIGSKANDVGIAHQVVDMKGELEKFREQIENLE